MATASGALVVGVTAGATRILIDCNAASTAAFAVESSLLGGIETSTVTASNEAALPTLATFVASTTDTGCPTGTAGSCTVATLSVPATFTPADAAAACPPTQAQVSAGLFGCAVAVVTSTLVPIPGGEFLISYAGQPTPAAPSIAATPTSGLPGSSIAVSDASGHTGYWWGNAVQAVQASTLGTAATAPPATCGTGGYGNTPSPFLAVRWFAAGSTTAIAGSATGVTISNDCYDGTTLHAPVLGGTITAPSTLTAGTTYTAYLCELNATPYPSNDTANATNCGAAPGGATWIDSSFTFTAISANPCNETVSTAPGTAVPTSSGTLIVGVSAGTTKITIDCNTASGAAIAVESSLLGGIVTSTATASNEADLASLATFAPAATDTGCPAAVAGSCEVATLTVPATYAAADTAAVCPPSQAQINAGLFGCAVAVANATNSPLPGGEFLLMYASQTSLPSAPTITAPATGAVGSGIAVSDVSGSTGYWWGNAIQAVQAAALATTPTAPPATCGTTGYGNVPTAFLAVNWFATGSTTAIPGSAAGVTISNDCYDGTTLHAPALGGTITVPSTLTVGTTYKAYLCELNATPFPSNDPANTTNCGPAPAGASWLDASFTMTASAAATVITQGAPTSGAVKTNGSTGFTDQLTASGNNGAVTYTQSTGSTSLAVSASGAVSTTGALGAGTYTATGTTSDPNGGKGTFTYALTVSNAQGPVGPHATKVLGLARAGKTVTLTINGSGFYGRPTITSNVAGTKVTVLSDNGHMLKIRVTVKAGSPKGVHTFTIRLANGKSCKVSYRQV